MLLQMTGFPSFLWPNCICVCVCERERERERVYVSHFLYSSVSRHLGCFHILAVVNNAAVTLRVMTVFPSIKCLEVELLGHTVVLFVIS